jgi:hypothetical protein
MSILCQAEFQFCAGYVFYMVSGWLDWAKAEAQSRNKLKIKNTVVFAVSLIISAQCSRFPFTYL